MKDIVKKVFEYSAVNDQIILVRCHGQNFNTMIIQFRFMFQPLMLKKKQWQVLQSNLMSTTGKQDMLLVVHKLEMVRRKIHLAGLANRNEGEW